MVRQTTKISKCTSAGGSRDGGATLHPSLGEALAGTLLGNDAALAIACLSASHGAAQTAGGDTPVTASPACGLAHQGDRNRRNSFADTLRCRVTWRLVAELFAAACERDLPEGAARRRPRCHMRQIAMYLSHVVLSVPYQSVATAFGRDRTTVMHACSVVEDRRDDAAYDRFVEQCERCIKAVFAPLEHDNAEL